MARSNDPFGLPLRQRPGDDPFAAPAQPSPYDSPAQAPAAWPHHPQQPPYPGFGQHQPAAPQTVPGYHFPAPEPQPAYGYNNPQLLASQQWPQHAEPQAYEANYQAYAGNDAAYQQGGSQQGYGDLEGDYGDEYYDDEEPRRGKRWLLIAAALVGAIGVGGALAYTYRSLVAPKSRLEAVRGDPGVRVRAGGPSVEQRAPVRIADPAPSLPPPAEPPPQESAAAPEETTGPRPVKTIAIGPSATPSQAVAAPAVPGISIYRPPELPGQPAARPPQPAAEPPPEAPSSRVTIGTRPAPPPPPPPAQAEPEEEPPPAAAPARRSPPAQVALAPVRPPPAPPPPQPQAKSRESSSGLGYVAVIKSEKSQMDAMKAFADLQQRYPDVLGEKSFDVQSADLSARGLGTMYRVVVGPPGSHNFASSVCAQLKSAGYVGCWVKEY